MKLRAVYTAPSYSKYLYERLPETGELSSSSRPQCSNLLRQHINYPDRLWCHLLQTGQNLIERSGYKKHL